MESPRSAASKDDRRDSFAARLRSHRLAAGLTQDQLAERAELSLRAIQNLERGDRRPYPDTARRLTAALQLTGEERASFDASRAPARAVARRSRHSARLGHRRRMSRSR